MYCLFNDMYTEIFNSSVNRMEARLTKFEAFYCHFNLRSLRSSILFLCLSIIFMNLLASIWENRFLECLLVLSDHS